MKLINQSTKTDMISSGLWLETRKIQERRNRRMRFGLVTVLTICSTILIILNTVESKSTNQLEREDHQIPDKQSQVSDQHQDLPELERPEMDKLEPGTKTKCVCKENLCVMSRDHDLDPSQITKVIEGGRPSRQSPNNQAGQSGKYATNSIEYRIADATNRFGLLFLNNLGTTKGNTIYSPVSLQAILNMLYLGAQPNSTTWRELAQGLGYEELNLMGPDEPHQALNSVYKDITDLLLLPDKEQTEDGEKVTSGTQKELNFTMTNLLLTNKNLVNISKEYYSTLEKYYTVRHVEFRRRYPNQPKPANLSLASEDPVLLDVESEQQLADVINSWVSDNTNHKIEKLVEASDVPLNDLALALVNSAYFQGLWMDKFDERHTREKLFYNEGRDDDKKTTKFMRKHMDVPYAQFMIKSQHGATNATSSSHHIDADLDCQAIELPFSIGDGKELSMLLLLPRQRQGLDKLQRSLTWSTLRGIYSALEEYNVETEIPKFTLEESYEVQSILERMGIRDIFDPSQAKLNKMLVPKVASTSAASFSVDRILHKAKIEVHESGAEAAASTYAAVFLRASINQPSRSPRFIADHPFIFIIRHNKSNLPLFMGRVNQV